MPAKVNPKAKRGSQNASQGKKESANVSQARKGGYHMSKPGQFAEALPAVADSDEAARLMEFKLHDLKISMTRMQQEVEDSSRPGRRATPRRAAQLGTQIAEAKEKVADLEPKVQDLRRVHSEKRAALDAILKQEKSAASSDPEGVKPVEVSEPKEGESSGSDGKGIAGLDGESDLSDLDEDHDEGNGDSEKGRKRGRSKAGATEQSSRKRAKTTPTTKPTRKKTRPKAQEKLPKAKEFHLQEDQGANTMNTDAPNKEPKPAPKSPAGTGHGEHAQRPNTVNNGGESQQLGTGNQATGSEGVLDEADLKEACKGDEHGRDGDGNDKGESGESGNGEGGKSYDSRPQATTSQGEPDAVEHDGGGDEGRKNDDPGVVSSAKTNQDNVSETPADKQANEGAVPAAKTNEKANEERVVSAAKINEKNVHEKKEGKGSNLQVHAQVPEAIEAIDAHRNEGGSDKGATTPQGSQPQGSGEDCEEKSGGNQAVAAPMATPGPETSQSKPDGDVKKKKRASKTRVTRVQGRSLQAAAAEEPEESHVDESDEEKTESWEFWKPEVRASMEVECRMQVARYLADPTGPDVRLSDRARAYVRYDAQNFPGAATACFDLARDVLVSGKGLIRCVYHHYSDKSTKKHDHSRDFMTGVRYPPIKAGKQDKIADEYAAGGFRWFVQPVSKDGVEYCHCGCTLEDAVWGLYLWKTGRIAYGKSSEGYTEVVLPRTRNMEITRLRNVGFELSDQWHYRRVQPPSAHARYIPVPEEARLQAHIGRLQRALFELLQQNGKIKDAKLMGGGTDWTDGTKMKLVGEDEDTKMVGIDPQLILKGAGPSDQA